MNILVFDNYDSFTYNLVHYLEKLSDCRVEVHRNDKIALEAIARFDKILLSPGPGLPSEAGILHEVIRHYAPKKSILGVCLGQQAIAEVYGGKLKNLDTVFHGVATDVEIVQDELLFDGLPRHFNAGRYHSWVVDATGFPAELEITAKDASGLIMALRHRKFDLRGVQFHPESILTEHGEKIIANWLKN
jgi:anthranilate synthase component 2